MKDTLLAGTTGLSVTTSLMANTLPWLQYIAALVGVITGCLFIYDFFTRRHKSDT